MTNKMTDKIEMTKNEKTMTDKTEMTKKNDNKSDKKMTT
jgi:hypothetical protein